LSYLRAKWTKIFWFRPGVDFRNRAEAHTTPIYVIRNGLRFWKYDAVEKLIADRLSDLNEIEEMVRLAHQSKREGKNMLNSKYKGWDLEFRIDPIISMQDELKVRAQQAKTIYDNLLSIYATEQVIRSCESN